QNSLVLWILIVIGRLEPSSGLAFIIGVVPKKSASTEYRSAPIGEQTPEVAKNGSISEEDKSDPIIP
ncbi:hypothetical protein KI387_032823, partial [Taxus chinensis]